MVMAGGLGADSNCASASFEIRARLGHVDVLGVKITTAGSEATSSNPGRALHYIIGIIGNLEAGLAQTCGRNHQLLITFLPMQPSYKNETGRNATRIECMCMQFHCVGLTKSLLLHFTQVATEVAPRCSNVAGSAVQIYMPISHSKYYPIGLQVPGVMPLKERNFLYSVIRQKYTWDNLLITSDLLLHILKTHQVFLPFLDCIHAFGFRMNDDDEIWEGCHRCYEWDPNCTRKILGYEIAYAYRYMAKNGRKDGSGWSVRQTAVYQKTELTTQCSVWILVQPSESVLKRFKSICQDFSLDGYTRQHALPHLVFKNSALEEWKSFTNYLRSSLQVLDEKACFVRVGKRLAGDYDISFSDAQSLQKLRRKLFRSIAILDEFIGVVKSCQEHYADLQRTVTDVSNLWVQQNLDELNRSSCYFQKVLHGLLQYSAGTAALLRQIPEYQLIEELNQTSKTLNDSILVLRNTATITQTEGSNMLEVARHNREDTVLIKTLTRITIIYLPATLIATIFSSNLIASQPAGQQSQSTHLVISPQFWIYVLVTIAFTVPTIGMPVLLERRQRRQRCLNVMRLRLVNLQGLLALRQDIQFESSNYWSAMITRPAKGLRLEAAGEG
ncbi:hypothetical protein CIB48_g3776 [Xylaria polymorpha]|nr:hypothetical protein CIB48_g3776 [Xylaria polymorpha]